MQLKQQKTASASTIAATVHQTPKVQTPKAKRETLQIVEQAKFPLLPQFLPAYKMLFDNFYREATLDVKDGANQEVIEAGSQRLAIFNILLRNPSFDPWNIVELLGNFFDESNPTITCIVGQLKTLAAFYEATEDTTC